MRIVWIFALFCGYCSSASLAIAQRETIVIDGSTGVTPLVAALAKEYQARNPGVLIDIGKGLGTTARIVALKDGKIDVAMASHGLDVEALTRQGLTVLEIAKGVVVFGVNETVPLSNIEEKQVCDIYSGKVKKWNELGGADLPISARTRPDSEVDAEVVRSGIACLKKLKMDQAVVTMNGAGDMARELAATTGAIGMTTLTVVQQSNGRVKALTLNGVAPTTDNVKNKTYALTRDSFLVTKSPPPPTVARFLEFVRGPGGSKVISASGAIPVN